MPREPRVALEVGAIVAVWVVALIGCQPGDTHRETERSKAKTPAESRPAHPAEPAGDAAPLAEAADAGHGQRSEQSGAAAEPNSSPQRTPQSADEPGAPADDGAGTSPDRSTVGTDSARPPDAAADSPSTAAGRVPASVGADGLADPNVLFQNWPQPQFVFLLTGQQHGYIEPCGCTGLENQKGGLARRHTLVRQLEERGWPVLPLDVGNQVRRAGRQAEIKFQMSLEGLRTIGYKALTLGTDDLRLSTGELVAATADLEGQSSPFVSANVAILDRSLTPRFRIVEIAGQKVGVTAVMGESWLDDIGSDEVVRQPPKEALQEVLPELEQAECDHYVLLAHATIEESQALAAAFPLFDLVVTAGGAGDPLYQPERTGPQDALLAQVGVKGMYAVVVGVYPDQLRYQRVPLDARFEDSPDMLQLMASYQEQLKELGLEGLGVKPLPHPSGIAFVGSQKCAECHETAFEIWSATPHAHATESLVHPGERTEIPRHFDPECLSCHVTGWNPQRYFPYTTGYLGLTETPLMHGNGCENCHGPGAEHVAAESGDVDLTEEMILARREAMRLPLAKAEERCLQCHDLDNSPGFHEEGAFQRYWEQVEHYE